MSVTHRIMLIGLLASLLVLSPTLSVMAARITINPNVQIKGEYDDNILFARTDKKADYSATLIPAITFTYETQLLKLKSNLAMDILRYADEDTLNTENYRYEISADYQAQEKMKLSGGFSYIKDTTLQSELEETGLVLVRADRKRFNASGGISYQLTELSDISLKYTHTVTEYDWPGSIDYNEDNIITSYNRQFNEGRDTFTVQPYFYHTSSEASVVDNYGLSLGLFHMFNETLTITAFMGGRYTNIEFYLIQPQLVSDPSLFPPYRVVYNRVKEKESTWGGVADISLKKTGETWSSTVGYNRDLTYSAFGEPINRDRIYASFSMRLTERLVMAFSGGIYFTQSEGQFEQRDSRYFDLRPSLSYQIAENHWLGLYYLYANDSNKLLAIDKEVDRNRIWISLQSNFPKEW